MRDEREKEEGIPGNLKNGVLSDDAAYYKGMFEMMIQNSPVSMYILEDSAYTYVNKHFCKLTGYSEEEILTGEVNLKKLVYPADLAAVQESVAKRIGNQEQETRYRTRIIRKGGEVRHIEVHGTKMIKEGMRAIFGTVFDVTEEVAATKKLTENKQRFKSLFYNNPDAIFAFDKEGKFIDANPGCEDFAGYSVEELLGMPFAPLIVSEHLSSALKYFEEALSGKTRRYEIDITRKDGKRRSIEVTSFPMEMEGEIIGAYGIAKDITDRIAHKKLMEDLVFFDPLTKLPNRKLFEDRLKQVFKIAADNKTQTAVLFLDLDRFKFINDSLGHYIGDEFLKIVSIRLQKTLRATDTVGRFAGDEFAVLIPGADEKETILLAQQLNQILAEPFDVMGHSLSVTASIGIAFSNGVNETVDSLIKKADTAMYQTKKYGKNNFTVYSKELDQENTHKLIIERDLKSAIKNQQFVLHYQPIIDLKTNELSAMEALIRWNHPELGLVSPDNFIPISEESGQIVSIGKWVLQAACSQNKKWQDNGRRPFKICVNISTIQLQHPNFVGTVKTVLEETGLDAKWLELEVTESILMEETAMLKDSLLNLKALGISMSIDDFGTGYTSLSYLRQFSFDRVKIDRSFIQDINNDLNGKAITSTIISLAHKLGLGVIAEGIEDDTQLCYLQKENCNEGQGYHFSRPLPAEKHELAISGAKA